MKYLKEYIFFESMLIDYIGDNDNSNIERYLNRAINYGKINEPDWSGTTPLSKAIEKNNFKVVKKIIENGGNINYINRFGNITFDYVEDVNMLKILIKNGADITFLHKIAAMNETEEIKNFVKENYPEEYELYVINNNIEKFDI